MTEEPFAQRIERLVQECNVPALLAEAQQLLTIYTDGDDLIDLEPILSALSILQRTSQLYPPEDYWNQEFTVTSVTRADLVSGGVNRGQAILLSDADMRAIASKMEDIYRDQGFRDDIVTALEYVQERKQPPYPTVEL